MGITAFRRYRERLAEAAREAEEAVTAGIEDTEVAVVKTAEEVKDKVTGKKKTSKEG
jgi:hypothetical protein